MSLELADAECPVTLLPFGATSMDTPVVVCTTHPHGHTLSLCAISEVCLPVDVFMVSCSQGGAAPSMCRHACGHARRRGKSQLHGGPQTSHILCALMLHRYHVSKVP